ncbi:universal stress protein PHOS34 [Selaginella moellendorffii]|uniref:universal stress protein PHOS34 n=1 Tax=Selaginella moellendorffii TaxID=88036 RepID=UPI000D1CE7B5|nr:universal stress protein PHOS34 [Selaginella moellendorffii]|eukprot:XP_024526278.1 universal stress protein PHOS34 [Selaginella moellendorffii]
MASGKRKIVAAVDDSEVSAYAFTWGLQNLVRPDDHVVAITVAPFVGADVATADMVGEYTVSMTLSPAESEAAQKQVTESSKALISKYLKQCANANISCEGEVVKGEPGSWIVDEANRVRADMVLVGSHAYGLIKRTLLGSISDFVLHNASCTVVIVRQPPEALKEHDPLSSAGLPRKIVIAVDDSKEAVQAFSWALENFCRPSDKVVLYHVHNPVTVPVTALGTGEFGVEDVYIAPGNDVEEEVKASNDSQLLVERFMKEVPKEISCEGMVVTGLTEAKVCEGLVTLKADAVVIGTQDRSVLSRTFLGSVSDYLAHHSPCPLVVVKSTSKSE